ncbi:DUF4177 domain-containing protein [Psychroserpens jangbogonensis]|uniref:DUF4177 domain-containing protein n=1 Tax=Psychroserpens jangbogonensis TaxID=1484460 RepID=UPI0009DFE0AC|nr:DUF4177 domain-containing protein [Psychroserpens jangbogonensis]
MKEYKVVKPKLGFRNTVEKLEDLINNHAREGWVVNNILPIEHTISYIIFERDKNR